MRTALAAVIGTVAIFGAVGVALLNVQAAADEPLVVAVVALLATVAFIGALVQVAGSGDPDAVAPAPWTTEGALVADSPERSRADHDLSGEHLADVVESAGDAARTDGTVAAGVEVVRPYLREAFVEAQLQGGTDRAAAERALAEGSWTDDPTAAAILDEAVAHPGWSLLGRFEAWLFPERTVRREVQQAMQAVAAAADDALPTVPGQHAPRTVPVLGPTLSDLRRGADGHLQRAVDPLGARRGSAVEATARVDDAETIDTETPDVETGDDADASDAGTAAPELGGSENDRNDGEGGDSASNERTTTSDDGSGPTDWGTLSLDEEVSES